MGEPGGGEANGFVNKALALFRKRQFEDNPLRKDTPIRRDSSVSDKDFLKNMWDGGALEFDPQKVSQELRADLEKHQARYDEHPLWRDADMPRLFESASYEYSWRRHFSGLVPARWASWIDCRNDFEEAGRRHLQLDNDLINAGVSHPHPITAREVGLNQTLNVDQLIMVLSRPYMSIGNIDEIIAAQRKRGVSDSAINEAEKRARRVSFHSHAIKNEDQSSARPTPKLESGN